MPVQNQPVASERQRPHGCLEPSAALAQRGVGLVEVLVAVLVLAIGLLGIVMLQSRSLSINNSSMTRSMAVAASYSILDAMRADRVQAAAGDYNRTGSSAINASDCAAAGTSLASQQINLWCTNELSGRLGEGAKAEINCTASLVCSVTITFHTLDCGKSDDGQADDGLCTQTVSEGRAQQVFTQAML